MQYNLYDYSSGVSHVYSYLTYAYTFIMADAPLIIAALEESNKCTLRERDNLATFIFMSKVDHITTLVCDWIMTPNRYDLREIHKLVSELEKKVRNTKWILQKTSGIVGSEYLTGSMSCIINLDKEIHKEMKEKGAGKSIGAVAFVLVDLYDNYMKVYEKSPYYTL